MENGLVVNMDKWGDCEIISIPKSKYHYEIKILNPNYKEPITATTDSKGRVDNYGCRLFLWVKSDHPLSDDGDWFFVNTDQESPSGVHYGFYDFYKWGTKVNYMTIIEDEGHKRQQAESRGFYDLIMPSGKNTIYGLNLSFEKPGKYTFYIKESIDTSCIKGNMRINGDLVYEVGIPVAKITVNVGDSASDYDAWLNKVVKECTTSSMTKIQKVQALSDYLESHLEYTHYYPNELLGYKSIDSNNDETFAKGGRYLRDQTTRFWKKGGAGVHCLDTPGILKDLTSLIGVTDVTACNHYAKVKIDDKYYFFYPTPSSRTTGFKTAETVDYIYADDAPEASVNPSISVEYYK